MPESEKKPKKRAKAKIVEDKKTGKTKVKGDTKLVIPSEKVVVFEISYVQEGGSCKLSCKGNGYNVCYTSTNTPPTEALVQDLIRGYLATRPQSC